MLDPTQIVRLHGETAFNAMALEVFLFQATHCSPYREYLALLGIDPREVERIEQIPFLPIELFKSHRIYAAASEPQQVFTSSTTTGQIPARHYVADLSLYEASFLHGFERVYGPAEKTAIFALLPSYLEREGSSLIYMIDRLIRRGGGGFYLHDQAALLRDLTAHRGPKILLGVSYALCELAEKHPTSLHETIIMETGGMKGQREELPRTAFHALLCRAFGVDRIHSEYGMAELLSQAYSTGEGLFQAPPWMQIQVRELYDPFAQVPSGQSGGINIIDLANYFSCSFLQTQDLGVRYDDGSFRILGRIDQSEVRGCNLLVIPEGTHPGAAL